MQQILDEGLVKNGQNAWSWDSIHWRKCTSIDVCEMDIKRSEALLRSL